jgi:glutamate--cysteine ligase catalytic subunit
LHWGEEVEYHLYSIDETERVVKLSCDASDILFNFNRDLAKNQEKPDFKLLPEFGNWMIEAVPSAPYGSCADPVQLLSCRTKINNRRKILQKILKNHGDGTIKIASTATPLILGTPHSMTSQDPEMKKRIEQAYTEGLTAQNNPRTHGQFIPEFTASPHPRFLGLA